MDVLAVLGYIKNFLDLYDDMVDSSALCDSLANRVRIIQSIVPKANDVEMSSQQSTALEHLCLVMQDCVAFIQKFKLKSSFVRFVQSNSTKKKYEGLCQKLSDVQLDLQTAFLVDLSASQQAILVELRSPVCIEEAWQKTLHETMYRIHNDHEETMALVQQQQDEQRAFLSQFADIDVVAALRDIGTLRGRMQDMYGIMEKVAKATSPPYMRPISSASVHIFPDRVLGVGAFGTVYHGTLDGAPCAVKMVLLSIHDKDAMAQFHREASICQRLRHPNCLQSYGWFERDSKPYLVTALAQRSLSDLFHCDESDDSIVTRLLSLSGRIRILKEVACGMRHIALKGIVHRDLKTANILLSSEGTAWISDFGFSSTRSMSTRAMSAFVGGAGVRGTSGYISPECLRGGKATEKSDVYAFGVMMCWVMMRRDPWAGQADVDALVERGIKPRIPAAATMGHAGDLLHSIIQNCLASDSRHRPDFFDVFTCLSEALVIATKADEEIRIAELAFEAARRVEETERLRLLQIEHDRLKNEEKQRHAAFVKARLNDASLQIQNAFEKARAENAAREMEEAKAEAARQLTYDRVGLTGIIASSLMRVAEAAAERRATKLTSLHEKLAAARARHRARTSGAESTSDVDADQVDIEDSEAAIAAEKIVAFEQKSREEIEHEESHGAALMRMLQSDAAIDFGMIRDLNLWSAVMAEESLDCFILNRWLPMMKLLTSLVLLGFGGGTYWCPGSSLALALPSMSSLTLLDLSENCYEEEDWYALAPALQSLVLLTSLNIEIRITGTDCFEAFSRSLQSLSSLSVLSIAVPYAGSDCMEVLSLTLQSLSSLTSLTITSGCRMNEKLPVLVPILRSLSFLPSLSSISFGNLGFNECESLALVLPSMRSLISLELKIHGVESGKVLAPSLRLLPSLTSLKLYSFDDAWNEIFSVLHALPSLTLLHLPYELNNAEKCSALTSCLQSLSPLTSVSAIADLPASFVPFSHTRFLHSLCLQIPKETRNNTDFLHSLRMMSSLTSLRFCFGCASDTEICHALFPALHSLSSLASLSIFGISLRAEECHSLGSALKWFSSLTELDLGGNNFGDDGCEALSPALQTLTFLNSLDLSYNRIDNHGCAALAPALTFMSSLASLNLASNQFSDEGCMVLADALQSINALTALHLSCNRFSEVGRQALAPALRSISWLNSIHSCSDNGISYQNPSSIVKFLTNESSILIENAFAKVKVEKAAREIEEAEAEAARKLAHDRVGLTDMISFSLMRVAEAAAECRATKLTSLHEKLAAARARHRARTSGAESTSDVDADQVDIEDSEAAIAAEKIVAFEQKSREEIEHEESHGAALMRMLQSDEEIDFSMIRELNLSHVKMNEEEFVFLIRWLPMMTSLTSLNLTGIIFPDSESLAKALPSLSSLTSLDLSHTRIYSPTLVPALLSLPTLTLLDLSYKFIRDEELEKLIPLLQVKSLDVNLSGNETYQFNGWMA